MTSQIPGISLTQSTAPVNAVASQPSNVTTPPEAPITQIDEQNGAKAMNGNDYIQKTAKVLQDTYFFKEEEARQISAFAKAVKETDPKLCPNVKPGFLDKIKALCARILQLFKVDSKSIQLHKDGIAVFNELKNAFLLPKNRELIFKILEENEKNPDVLKGFARLLGVNIPDDIDSVKKFYDFFINPQLLKKHPDVKAFLEQEVLPLTQDEVLAGLRENLEKPSKDGGEWANIFAMRNVIFRDLGRKYTCTFHVGNQTIELNILDQKCPEGVESRQQYAFNVLCDAIRTLPEDQQERVREFCKNFPSQGVLALQHPRMSGWGRIDCGRSQFEVSFKNEGLVHVEVSSKAGTGKASYLNDVGSAINTEITTPGSKFEFDYHPEDGSSSNVKVLEYSGQTVSIV